MNYAVTPGLMRALEQRAFSLGASPLLMMEEAADAVVQALLGALGGCAGKRVLVVSGPGNNGGDGLAAARRLIMRGARVTVWQVGGCKTEEARVNLAYAKALGVEILELAEGAPAPLPRGYDAVLDALLGTGLTRPPEGLFLQVIEAVNALSAPVVLSVDIPSGMDGATGSVLFDESGRARCVHATHTVTLGYPKFGLYLTPARDASGKLTVAPLAIPTGDSALSLPGKCPALGGFERETAEVAQAADLPDMLPRRSLNAHKGTCGRVLLYAGSEGFAGAAAMAAKAALRAGAGLVTLACERELIPLLQTLVPNAMCAEIGAALKNPPAHGALAAGCGIGTGKRARAALLGLIENEKAPVVLDADALNLLASEPFELPENVVLTPHVGEAARLLHCPVGDVLSDMPGAARALAQKYRATVALKSAVTVISDGARLAFNETGSPALSKGGSGDALTGMIAALLADREEKRAPFAAAQTACLWLGLAGERAGARLGERSALTGDVLDSL